MEENLIFKYLKRKHVPKPCSDRTRPMIEKKGQKRTDRASDGITNSCESFLKPSLVERFAMEILSRKNPRVEEKRSKPHNPRSRIPNQNSQIQATKSKNQNPKSDLLNYPQKMKWSLENIYCYYVSFVFVNENEINNK